jgi:putative hydrolase of the HAD superfamily
MIQRPQQIFFDLDHTLWDYATNARETVQELFVRYEDHFGKTVDFGEFYPVYKAHNMRLWEDYRNNLIDAFHLRLTRWQVAFADFGVADNGWMLQFSEDFITLCPQKLNLIPNAWHVLEILSRHYPLHIISNGLAQVQDVKLASSGLRGFFDVVVTPDVCDSKKPDAKIFLHALERAGCVAQDALFIGDNYEEDVLGGISVGMNVVYFNPEKEPNPAGHPQIEDLMELVPFLVG